MAVADSTGEGTIHGPDGTSKNRTRRKFLQTTGLVLGGALLGGVGASRINAGPDLSSFSHEEKSRVRSLALRQVLRDVPTHSYGSIPPYEDPGETNLDYIRRQLSQKGIKNGTEDMKIFQKYLNAYKQGPAIPVDGDFGTATFKAMQRIQRSDDPAAQMIEDERTLSFGRPLPKTHTGISSGFRSSRRPRHDAIDIPAERGTPIYAVEDGVVTFVGAQGTKGRMKDVLDRFNLTPQQIKDYTGIDPSEGAGMFVKVVHGTGSNKAETLYAHMGAFAEINGRQIAVGDRVTKGTTLGYVGVTGNTSGAHLHFRLSIWKNGRRTSVNPLRYLRDPNAPEVEKKKVDVKKTAEGDIVEVLGGSFSGGVLGYVISRLIGKKPPNNELDPTQPVVTNSPSTPASKTSHELPEWPSDL